MSVLDTLFFSKRGNPWGDQKPTSRGTRPQERPSARKEGAPRGQQPDIDDILREAQNRMRSMMGGGRGGAGGNGSFNGGQGVPSGKLFSVLFALAMFVWLASGIYIVAPDENGVVLRFGKYVKTVTEPGPKYHLPYPIETVMRPKVTRENITEIGFRGSRDLGQMFGQRYRQSLNEDQIIDVPKESLMLTGDENIVDLDFTVRWRIGRPENFLFKVDDPVQSLKDVAESAMREVIGRHPIDDALTENRSEIQEEVRALMQEVADLYEMGILVSGVELQQVNPPEPVIEAFRDVQAARADKERMQNEAIGYANDILPKARGDAARIMQEAEAYKAARIAEATGAAQRFNAQVEEYRKAQSVTRERLYYETMQDVLTNTNKVVLSKESARSILPYLPVDTLKKGGTR